MLAGVALLGVGLLAQEPCAVTVQPGESIQAAIDAAPEGVVICLAEGEWEEHITIEKSLTLRGDGAEATVLRGRISDRPVVKISVPWRTQVVVAITGVSITDGRGFYNGEGVLITGNAQTAFTNCTVSGNRLGIALWDRAQATITGCTIAKNEYGIWLSIASQATITACTVSSNNSGIILQHDAQASIERCTVSGNKAYGISCSGNARASVTGCTVSESWTGIILWDGTQATVEGCTVSDSNYGFSLYGSSQATITGSTVSGSERGITLFDGAQATIQDNIVQDSEGYGISPYELPCVYTDWVFTGHVTGKGNTGGGNADGDYCPEELAFLFTEEGGELDRRE